MNLNAYLFSYYYFDVYLLHDRERGIIDVLISLTRGHTCNCKEQNVIINSNTHLDMLFKYVSPIY